LTAPTVYFRSEFIVFAKLRLDEMAGKRTEGFEVLMVKLSFLIMSRVKDSDFNEKSVVHFVKLQTVGQCGY
jgi:hypothetical protein